MTKQKQKKNTHNATYSWNLYIMPLIHGIYNDQSHRNRKQNNVYHSWEEIMDEQNK